ncbi:putative U6 snRNA-associated Sm-like protein LSm3 [Gregarina niphandrodes]|uniref:U6 snRNA-associated Sm-like protein LSm3 n=1 Tax=Gregarina niphandrodes TaxID=110365 RepID=A0A023B5S5_GRENI|nr:putative U6 snRNA-associated Sm-like protein LSm3 [Gregarina niphandrodes]EZG61137.1 putative U6 snRNA-associated Sm-like protein LSm3 [Gregarina niphandrodes]|eukprot:XP_011130790.1 putative U6 snRNA-associated Sm-like protein LSm3 [Gregarina niphandrodes]
MRNDQWNKRYFVLLSLNSPHLLATSCVLVEPLDLARLSLGDKIHVKCRGGRKLEGILHAYDPHLNLIIGPVAETLEEPYVDEKTGALKTRATTRLIDVLFVRGDGVILIAPVHC